jgi:hypothetical protein
MKQVRRGFTLSALNVFIHHFFSLSWLREYLIEKRLYNFVHYDEEENDDLSNDENSTEERQLLQESRKQIYFDLMFLVRTAHEWYPTAQLFSEIMKHFDALEGNYTLTDRKASPFTPLNSLYFSVAMFRRTSLTGQLVHSWKKVANIPLEKQLENGCYAEAKIEEMKALEAFTEEEFSDSEMRKFVETWLNMDCKLSSVRERTKSQKDLQQYYKFLSQEAKNKDSITISKLWDLARVDERSGGRMASDQYLLMVWSFQRVNGRITNEFPVRRMWLETADFYERSDGLGKRTARLAFGCEKSLKESYKLEEQLMQFTIPNNKDKNNLWVYELILLVSQIPGLLRLQLLVMLSQPVDEETILSAEAVVHWVKGSLETFRADWTELSTSIIECIENRVKLIDFYKDLIVFVEKQAKSYLDKFLNHFKDQVNRLQTYHDI